MKIYTSALTGAALDWAVAKCGGIHITFADGTGATPQGTPSGQWEAYSTNWAQAGPIIERENITLIRCNDLYFPEGNEAGDYWEPYWRAEIKGATDLDMPLWRAYGPTPLIAAMRCYVAAKLGDEVDVPDALVGHHHDQPVGLATLHMRDTQIAQLTVALANAREQVALWRTRAHKARCF